ncbi:MAG: FtsX-like permease family protein [Pseudomonadota bacterium]
MKGQVIAIALVIVSGVATFVMLRSTMNSLKLTQDKFYQDYSFADVFASLKRAPESLKSRIASIPGVEQIETRVVADVKLNIEGFNEPVSAKLVSVPENGKPLLNRIYIKKGRMVDPWKDNEVVVSEPFADAHRFSLGDRFGAVINGKWKMLTIVGTALSPEYILQIRPGGITVDFKRYAILWMGRPALGTAYNMKGAFNDVVLKLSPDANKNDTLVYLDNLLNWYGGLGSYTRNDQVSHRFLTEEFKQLETSSKLFPILFMGVAAFLLHVVISRTVSTQSDQIAVLKAFGYSNLDVGIHYMAMVSLIVMVGVTGGVALGVWFSQGLGRVYMEFYRFPYLMYELKPSVVTNAILISIASALAGTLYSVRKAANLPPAEAMRPEPPAKYRRSIFEHIHLWNMLSQPTRIIIRNIERRPIRSLLTIIGIALSCASIIAATFFQGAIDFMINVQFKQSQKEDITVTFIEPTSRKALHELKGLEGVEDVEVFRSVPAKLKFHQRSYRTSIRGIEPDNRLHILLDTHLKRIDLPPEGIVLTDYLGNILGVKPGDMLTVEVLEGSKPQRQVPVVGLRKQYIGLMGYMDLSALNHLMREDQTISGAYLTVDSINQPDIYRTLVKMPRVGGTFVREDEIRNFYETQAEALLFFTFVASLLAATIAFGVVYNSARIALSERGRELASLRVLGYTRTEISFIFLGELGLLTLVAIPIGFIIGKGMSAYLAKAIESDLFRVPVLVEPTTYSLAATVVVVSACLSGLIVRHRLDHLDLVEALKTKE